MVNIKIQLMKLRVVGLPADLVAFIEVWLTDRMFYVEVYGVTSIFHHSNSGTIQGSILGPILYAIFVSPLSDLIDLFNFADDNFTLAISKKQRNSFQTNNGKTYINHQMAKRLWS